VMILADGALGQMMEKVEFPDYDPKDHIPAKPWATTGKTKDRERNIITSLHIQPEKMEEINLGLQKKYREVTANEVRCQLVHAEEPEILVIAYGLAARICHKAVEMARAMGKNVALLRPITLFPYPYDVIAKIRPSLRAALVVEMNAGQMVEDVRLGIEGAVPVHFFGRMGGIIPTPEEVLREILRISENPAEGALSVGHGMSIMEESR
jgi:2-oxoglutarate ferredoxin oxidoreductase subunit alpha